MKVTIKTKVGPYYVEISDDLNKEDPEYSKKRNNIIFQAKWIALAVKEKLVDEKPKQKLPDMNNDMPDPLSALMAVPYDEENEDSPF